MRLKVAVPERLRTREGGRNGHEGRGGGHAGRTGGRNRVYDCLDSLWPRPSEGVKYMYVTYEEREK